MCRMLDLERDGKTNSDMAGVELVQNEINWREQGRPCPVVGHNRLIVIQLYNNIIFSFSYLLSTIRIQ